MRRLAVVMGLVVLCACSPPGGKDGGTGGGSGGGSGGGGGGLDPFSIIELDPGAREATYFAAAFDPAQERVGVVYYKPTGTETVMGHPDYEIKYLEYRQGQVSAIETVRRLAGGDTVVQRKVGLTIAFDPTSGEPTISYVGGAAGFVMGMSIFWFQSDAVINSRNAGTWGPERVIAVTGADVTCGNPVSDRGLLVGIWPSLLFDPMGKLYFAYRDGHDAQFPLQDWSGSDVELFEGVPPAMTGRCLMAGGNNKGAWGGHIQLAMGAGQPAVVYDTMPGTSDQNGSNVIFQKRNADGTWTPAANLINIANTQTGPSLAYDAMEGYGIAAVDRATNQLSYINSSNGTTWSALDPVFGSGSGGWYPSLAMDPVNHEPAIAFYVCSPRNGLNETSCTTTEDELRVTQRIGGNWRETVVDRAGGYAPKLGFFASGKRVLVYRQPPSIDPMTGLTVTNVGALKLAVER